MTHLPADTPPRVSTSGRLVRALLRSPLGGRLGRSLIMLRIRGRRSGWLFELPVQYAITTGGVVVYPGHPETKQWWRNLREPASVEVLRDGTWHHAGARVLVPVNADHAADYARAAESYALRWPRFTVAPGDSLVLISWVDERDLAR